jgi:drug/metabolite transporter (DMT)-like permease
MSSPEGDAPPHRRFDRHAWLVGNAYLLLAFADLCWSGNHLIGRAVTGHVPPIGLSTVRWVLPALVLWPLARRHMQRDWPIIKSQWVIMLLLGLTGGALFSALQYVGLQHTTALNVSVLNSLVPVLIVLAGTLVFRDRIHIVQVVGIATSLVGVLVIVSKANLEALKSLAFSPGDVIILINMAVFAIYAACLRLQPPIHWLSFMFMLAMISAAATFPFFIWETLAGFPFEPTLRTGVAIAYVSVFPGVLAFAAWNRAVDLIGANRAGPFLHLIAIFTAILGYVFLGEVLALYHVAGFIMILIGVWLASVNPRIGR